MRIFGIYANISRVSLRLVYGPVAHLVERLICNEEASGSSPLRSTSGCSIVVVYTLRECEARVRFSAPRQWKSIKYCASMTFMDSIGDMFKELLSVWGEMFSSLLEALPNILMYTLWIIVGILILPSVFIAGHIYPWWTEWGEDL